ncbi:MAG: SBBP repeat-containing protein [Acidobacteria bacterium]|nr:SBBP repeat-containing protein [Acidobacteriota bacterium]
MDGAGAAYVTGFTRSTNFPTANPVQAANGGNGNRDAFILKLNPAGSALAYSTYLGGSSGDEGRDIAVDSMGSAHIVGQTFSTNFSTANPLQSINGGGSSDAFIAKLNPAGSALIYSTYLGGNGSDTGTAIAVDSFGDAFVTGDTASTNFPTKNPFQVSLGGQSDAFVSIVTSTGSALVYSTYLGGNGSDFGRGIALDASGAVVVAGSVDSTNFPTVNPLLASPAGSYDIFVSKFNTIGSALVFSTYLGGFSQDDANSVALDTVGNVYLTGRTTSTNFPVQNPIQNGLSGVGDVFVTKISEINVQPTPTPTPTPSPATVSVASATKTCIPTDAYPRIEAQPAAGPNFGAIPEQPPTQIRCTFEAEVVLDGVSGNNGPVTLTIFDGFSPGLFFDRLTASSPTLTVAGYTGNVLTFNPILLQLPPQTVLQRFRISFEYFAFLNDLAEQRIPQQNCITMRFNDAVTGRLLLERGGICADTNVLVPRLTLEKYANTTTGLPGDTLKFTVIALSGGSIFLQTLDLDAIIPNNTTLVPGSIDPPPTRVVGNRIEWRGLGPINARGALPVSYSVTIDANTPADAKLVDQAFAKATTPNFAAAGTRMINAASNKVTVMVMSVRTGVDLTLTAAPAAGCPLTIINYTAVVTNTGQVTLDRLRLSLYPGTEPVAGNPEFPIQLDPLGPGESRTITYKGQIGLKQKGTLVDIVTVVGRPVNNGIQVSELVGKVATATVRVSPPGISKITPASGPPGSSNLELKIEGLFCSGDGREFSIELRH